MIITHATNNVPAPRLPGPAVHRAARVMPVVVVTGARQTGKSTLVRDLLGGNRAYFTLDDIEIRAQAEHAPADLVRGVADLCYRRVVNSWGMGSVYRVCNAR